MSRFRTIAAITTVLLLTGCPGNDVDDPFEQDLPPAAEDMPLERETERTELRDMEGSGVFGEVTLTALTVDETEISLQLTGAAPNEELFAELVGNDCTDADPLGVPPIGTLPIDPDGVGITTGTVDMPLDDVWQRGHFVRVIDDGEPIACAALGGND